MTLARVDAEPAFSGRRVLVTRAASQADDLVSALRDVGLAPIPVPTIAVELEPPGGDLDAAARRLGTYAWVVVTSANGARAILDAAERVATPLVTLRWAAVGRATSAVLQREGIVVEFQPSRASSIAMAAELPVVNDERVLLVRGDLADVDFKLALRARGADVDDVVGYRTREAPEASRLMLRRAMASGHIDAVLFTSGSTVRGLVALARAESLDIASIPAVCIGPETADEARDAGFSVMAVSATPDAAVLAATTADAIARHPKELR
jgi:uroporphyrinogen-III synthase